MNGGDYGKVVFWNDAGGYGFIRPDRAERDVFFSRQRIEWSGNPHR